MNTIYMRVLLFIFVGLVFSATAANQPNVIVILSDDQGYADFSVHGSPDAQTPNLDKLAHDGVRLSDFHVDPTCSPTRAALMTGRYATRVGVWLTFAGRNHLHKEETTMAEVFKHNGYRTAIFGKWHLGDNYPFRPEDRGFDKSFIHGGGVVGEVPDYWANNYFDDVYFNNGVPTLVEGYAGKVWFEQAKTFIGQNKQNPFFIYLPVNTPHGPFNVPADKIKPYLAKGLPETQARFFAMIETIDEGVGDLRGYLKAQGLDKNTLIVYMTDNGTTQGYLGDANGYPQNNGYNAGMRGRKTSAYEGGHRAASFWYWPRGGLTGNRSDHTLSAHIDVLPTFVDMLALKLPSAIQFDGQSLQKVLLGKTDSALNKRTLVVHNQARFGKPLGAGGLIKYKDYSVMQGDWRLVGKSLYNLKSDKGQRNDIAAQHPQKAAQLMAFYEDWWQEVKTGERLAPTIIDPLKQFSVKLTSQAWRSERAIYDQSHVIAGIKQRGLWHVEIAKAGHYSIEFSRWPKEASLGFNQSYVRDMSHPGLDPNFNLYNFKPRTLKVKKVGLLLDGKTMAEQNISSDLQQSVRFDTYLPAGIHTLEGLMHEANGSQTSAYYMYLKPKL